MIQRGIRVLGVGAIILALASLFSVPAGVRTVGVRVILPGSGIPGWLGFEVSTDLSFGIGSASFFLTSSGKTLIIGNLDLRLGEGEAALTAFLRLSAGLAYFDSSRLFPSLFAGGGVSYWLSSLEPLAFGFAGELLYPIALPFPMFTLSGGWRLP